MDNFSFTCTVAAEESSYPNKGFVTHHMTAELLNEGAVDMYLCGPPPMVDAVRKYLADQGIQPANFYYEKFSGSGVVSEIGEIHVKVPESDEAFDARMALELGAAHMVCGKLSAEQIAQYRRWPRRRQRTSRATGSPTRRASARPTRRSTSSRWRPRATRR